MSRTLIVQNGDWYTDSRGRFEYTGTSRQKCAQDVANVLLQRLRDNWGSEIADIDKGKAVTHPSGQKALIQSRVAEAVDRLRALQTQDLYADDEEKIDRFTVTVEKYPDQSLSYFYLLEVKTVAGDAAPLRASYLVNLEQTRDPNLVQE